MTKIEWCHIPGYKGESWNPITGCDKVSPGCKHCYAERMAKRLAGRFGYPRDEPFKVTLHPDRLDQPLRWQKPRGIFVCSMGDLFHDDVPNEFIRQVFFIMGHAITHRFMILTKRPERMKIWFTRYGRDGGAGDPYRMFPPALPNVWLGVSVERPDYYDRIHALQQTPAAIRFISLEPLLAGVPNLPLEGIDQVLLGCESGPGRRQFGMMWAFNVVRDCKAAGVPVFVKQLSINGRVSHDPDEWPEELRVREWPTP